MHEAPLRLAIGSHRVGSGKGCAMNVISWESGDTTITDFPECSDRLLAQLVQRANDAICLHRDGDLLCPDCSQIALRLAHRTVGTRLDWSRGGRAEVYARMALHSAVGVGHLASLEWRACNAVVRDFLDGKASIQDVRMARTHAAANAAADAAANAAADAAANAAADAAANAAVAAGGAAVAAAYAADDAAGDAAAYAAAHAAGAAAAYAAGGAAVAAGAAAVAADAAAAAAAAAVAAAYAADDAAGDAAADDAAAYAADDAAAAAAAADAAAHAAAHAAGAAAAHAAAYAADAVDALIDLFFELTGSRPVAVNVETTRTALKKMLAK